jgi:hypothetical protein
MSVNYSRAGSAVQIQASSWQRRWMCSVRTARSDAHVRHSVPVRPVAGLGQPAPVMCETPPVRSGGHWHDVLRYQAAHGHHRVRAAPPLVQSVHP